jgi:hypothetical protein
MISNPVDLRCHQTYHDGFESLAHLAFALAALVYLAPQAAGFVTVAAHLGLCLFTAQHGALESGVCGFALELACHRGVAQVVELADFIVDIAIALVGPQG